MTDDAFPSSSTPAPQTHAVPKWIPWLSLALAVGALTLSWQSQQRFHALEQELVRRQQSSQTEVTEARIAATQSQELAHQTAGRAALLEARVNEFSTQRAQIEELLQSLSRTRDDSLLADMDAALRMAQQQSELTGNAEPLMTTLRSLDERLARGRLARFEPMRQAITRDLDALKLLPSPDISTLVQHLDEAVGRVDGLQLRNAAPLGVPSASATAPLDPEQRKGAVSSAAAWARFKQWWMPIWQELGGLIRVSRIEHPEAVLIMPDQAYFLRENLKLKLLNARLSLLARQYGLVQADLAQVQAVLPRYFEADQPSGIAFTAMLNEVTAQSQNVIIPRPEQSLAWLQTAMVTSVTLSH
jgi:uroporphyrin-3 C-methyltransferase